MTKMQPVRADEKTQDIPGESDAGYAAWKRAKIERGLAEATDRDAMIPAEKVLEDLKLAR